MGWSVGVRLFTYDIVACKGCKETPESNGKNFIVSVSEGS